MVVQNFFSPGGSNLSDGDNLEKKILVKRCHRRDEEAFYLPCVLSLDTVEAFLGVGLGWLYDYTYERVHSGYGMEGRTLDGCGVGFCGFSVCGFDAGSVIGRNGVILVACRFASCERCVGSLHIIHCSAAWCPDSSE